MRTPVFSSPITALFLEIGQIVTPKVREFLTVRRI